MSKRENSERRDMGRKVFLRDLILVVLVLFYMCNKLLAAIWFDFDLDKDI